MHPSQYHLLDIATTNSIERAGSKLELRIYGETAHPLQHKFTDLGPPNVRTEVLQIENSEPLQMEESKSVFFLADASGTGTDPCSPWLREGLRGRSKCFCGRLSIDIPSQVERVEQFAGQRRANQLPQLVSGEDINIERYKQ